MAETLLLFREKGTQAAVTADLHTHALPSPDPGGGGGGGGCTNQLVVTVQCCRDLPCSPAHKPSPFVVYKFSHFPDCPTATVDECSQPHFDHVRCFTLAAGSSELERYLRSERLHFYVFDYTEKRMDEYLGKAAVELLPLALGQEVSGKARTFILSLFRPTFKPFNAITCKSKFYKDHFLFFCLSFSF